MGLRSKLNKMKNFLFDEEEVEKPKKVKKIAEKKQVEVSEKSPVKEEKNLDDFYFDDIPPVTSTLDKMPVKSRVQKEEFNFPEISDDDFMKPVTKKEVIKPVKFEDPKPTLYQGSKRKEETKKFKPSPIISPIYGLLDNDGNRIIKNDIKKENDPVRSKDDITFDEIRKKAYGDIDREYENTLSRLSNKTIEEAEEEMENEVLSRTSSKKDKANVSYKTPIIAHDDGEEDDMVLPNVDFKEIDIDKKYDKKKAIKEQEEDEDTKEQDLFNLIDTIYSGEEKNKK